MNSLNIKEIRGDTRGRLSKLTEFRKWSAETSQQLKLRIMNLMK